MLKKKSAMVTGRKFYIDAERLEHRCSKLYILLSNSHPIFQILINKNNLHLWNFRNSLLVQLSQHRISAGHLMWMREQLHLSYTEPRSPEVSWFDNRSARINHSAHFCLRFGPSYKGSIVAAKIKSQGCKSAPSYLPTSLHATKDIIFSRVTV